MTIAKRLSILLALLLGALLLVGGVGIYQMRNLAQGIQIINNNIIPSQVAIDRIAMDFSLLRGDIFRHVLANGETEKTKMEKEMRHLRDRIEQDLEKYKIELITDDQDKDLLSDDQNRIKAYFQVLDQVILLSRNNQQALATEQLIAARALVDSAIEAFRKHSEYNQGLTNREGQQAQAHAEQGVWSVALSLSVASVLGLFLGLTTYRKITQALSDMRRAMSEIATHRDFTRRLLAKGADELAQTSSVFNRLVETIQASLKVMRQNAEQVSAASSELSSAAKQVSIGSDEQSEAASHMASAVEELTVSINHVSDRASEANSLVIGAGRAAHAGATVIGKTLDDIQHIEQAVKQAASIVERLDQGSAKVTAVVSVIREVADQTNLLALNAAIEAARAGEQGRGFAVVADEVRKLAERTAQSTQEIASTISIMQGDASAAVNGMLQAVEQVEQGVTHAQEAEAAIREIEQGAEQTVEMVGEISAAIREQSVASATIAQQVERIAQMSEENNAAAGNTADNSDALAKVAKSMHDEVERYRT